MLCVGARCQSAQCLLRPILVVFPAPGFDDGPGVQQVGEPVFVEALVAQAPVEGFDVGVLVRLAGLYVLDGDAIGLGPCGSVGFDLLGLYPVPGGDSAGGSAALTAATDPR